MYYVAKLTAFSYSNTFNFHFYNDSLHSTTPQGYFIPCCRIRSSAKSKRFTCSTRCEKTKSLELVLLCFIFDRAVSLRIFALPWEFKYLFSYWIFISGNNQSWIFRFFLCYSDVVENKGVVPLLTFIRRILKFNSVFSNFFNYQKLEMLNVNMTQNSYCIVLLSPELNNLRAIATAAFKGVKQKASRLPTNAASIGVFPG